MSCIFANIEVSELLFCSVLARQIVFNDQKAHKNRGYTAFSLLTFPCKNDNITLMHQYLHGRVQTGSGDSRLTPCAKSRLQIGVTFYSKNAYLVIQ